MILAFDRGCGRGSEFAVQAAEYCAAAIAAEGAGEDLGERTSFETLHLDGDVAERRTTVRRLLEERGASHLDSRVVETLAACPCFFVTPDGVAGPIEGGHDLELFCREVRYHSLLARPVSLESFGAIGPLAGSLALEAALSLDKHGAVVVPNFFGADEAAAIAAVDLDGLEPACPDAKLGSGRGDAAALPDLCPEVDAFLAALDTFVLALRSASIGCEDRLRFCEFRSWPMVAAYAPATRYTWHRDNGQRVNGRALTCVYYLNRDWSLDDGGALRLLVPPEDGQEVPRHVLAEVLPLLDTLVAFWSPEVPHEVLPPRRRIRRAISVWYLCPRLGAEHFISGSPLPVSGQTATEAAQAMLDRCSSDAKLEFGEAAEWLRQEASGMSEADGGIHEHDVLSALNSGASDDAGDDE